MAKPRGWRLKRTVWLFEELTANQNQLLTNHDNGRAAGQYTTKINLNTPAAKRLMQFMTQAIQMIICELRVPCAEADQQTAF